MRRKQWISCVKSNASIYYNKNQIPSTADSTTIQILGGVM